MRLILALLFCFLLSGPALLQAQEDFRAEPPKAGKARAIEFGAYEEFELDNGLKVIVVENHKLPQVSLQVFVDVPPMLEGEKAGLSEMAGELLSRGTTQRSKAEIDEAVDFLGASLSTSSRGLFASSLTKHLDELLGIVTEVLFQPAFPPEEFDKLKKQTLSALAQAKEDPNAIASNVSDVLCYGSDHPYGDITTEETVGNISLEECRAYYDTHFRPNTSYLVIVGDIKPKEARRIAKTYFGDWEKAEVPNRSYPDPAKPGKRQVGFVNKTGAVQSVINLTYPVELPYGDPAVIKANVMNTAFGGYFSSRLNENIREDKGYSYGVRSSLSPDRYVGSFSAGGSVRNEVTDSALTEFIAEMEAMRKEPLPEEELQLVKNVIAGSFARSLESPQTIARFALNTARYDLPKDYYPDFLKKLEAVSAADVQAMAKKYLTPDNCHILVVGNEDEVAEKLLPFDADGELSFYSPFGKPLNKSADALPAGLTAEKVVEDYINAIGGRAKLEAVEDLTTIMSTEVQGMSMRMEMKKKAPGKMAMTMTMNGNPMQQTIYDGTKAKISQMGDSKVVEGEEAEEVREQAIMFTELEYPQRYEMELKGVEEVDGNKAYKLLLTDKDGNKTTEFYDARSSLKLRTVVEQAGKVITNDYGDYKEVEGIMVPHLLKTSGAAPFPIELKVEEVKVNAGLPDETFAIE
jgi:predicted Zn-dependent peptidase